MRFLRCAPSAHYRVLRLASPCGTWEIGLADFAYGARLRMGHAGRPPDLFDLCIGRDARLYAPALLGALNLLESVPEPASAEEIRPVFPWYGRRPDASRDVFSLARATSISAWPGT